MREKIFNPKVWLFAGLTLGLAPFVPEPHLWGKIKWIMGGATGMQATDWFDFFFHLSPWLLLIISLAIKIGDKSKS